MPENLGLERAAKEATKKADAQKMQETLMRALQLEQIEEALSNAGIATEGLTEKQLLAVNDELKKKNAENLTPEELEQFLGEQGLSFTGGAADPVLLGNLAEDVNRNGGSLSPLTGAVSDPLNLGKDGRMVEIPKGQWGAGTYSVYQDENGQDVYVSSRMVGVEGGGKEYIAYTMNAEGKLEQRGSLSPEELKGAAISTHMDDAATAQDLQNHMARAEGKEALIPGMGAPTASYVAGVGTTTPEASPTAQAPETSMGVNPNEFPTFAYAQADMGDKPPGAGGVGQQAAEQLGA